MRRSILVSIIVLGSVLLLISAGCYQPAGSVPEAKHPGVQRAWTAEDVDAAVSMSMESIPSPAPKGNGVPPDECNQINYLRFRLKQENGSIDDADAIIVLMPGLLGGAGEFVYLGRQMVYMALEQKGLNIEVWAVDRRANNLEDLTGLNAAEQAKDIKVAIDYYYNGAEIDGHKFKGFLEGDGVPCLSEFGLDLALRDVYNVITTKVPDPGVRREKVFVGGHSLGGPLTRAFAGWDFDGDPSTLDDAGYMNCAGLIGMDTSLENMIPGMPMLLEQLPENMVEGFYAGLLEKMRSGEAPRLVPIPLASDELFCLVEMMGLEAAWHPDEESTLLHGVPYSGDVDFALETIACGSMESYITRVPSIKDFRCTNEALLGVSLDDNFEMITALQASVGFLSGGPVVAKQFPLPQNIAQLPFLSLLKSAINIEGLFVPGDAGPSMDQLGTGPLYTWANFDEIGNSSDPNYTDAAGIDTFTTVGDEVTDIQDLARFLYKGPTNALEWYFPFRIIADLGVVIAQAPFAGKYGLSYMHPDAPDALPKIVLVCEKGPISSPGFSLMPEEGAIILKGYNHMDVVCAAADRPSLRKNEVIMPIIDFVMKNIGG